MTTFVRPRNFALATDRSGCPAPLRTRSLDHARGRPYRGPGRLPGPDLPWLAISSCARSTHVIWISSFCHGARADGHTPGHQVHAFLRRGLRLGRHLDNPHAGSLALRERVRREVGAYGASRVSRPHPRRLASPSRARPAQLCQALQRGSSPSRDRPSDPDRAFRTERQGRDPAT